ncbi:MAG TPA: nucleoside-diphosphate kinase [Armatimonadota bacterium]|nr:nucleoside-diphosphate kinase [Armatimonadota bacterium]HOP79182.1 nucleoside-diphosphate kinase [Armatimonadota bacterium]HPP75860.1 nucleoside-diphosphate kinase [Armatimonadota bacterium]
MERTFVMIKPDGVKRRLVGEIIRRFEDRGFNIVAMKMLTPSLELAEQHYAIHRDKPFYEGLVSFITSGPVVPMVLEAPDAVRLVRNMIGALNPADTLPGTIRGDFTVDTQQNLIHGADAPETAEMEIALWFPELK